VEREFVRVEASLGEGVETWSEITMLLYDLKGSRRY